MSFGEGGSPAAGWFPDPDGRHEARWWDGGRWTDDVADGEVRTTDPTGPRPAIGAPQPSAGLLDGPGFVMAMPPIHTTEATLPVLALDDQRPLGWVHVGAEPHRARRRARWATLVDPGGVPLLGARVSTSLMGTGGGIGGPPGTVHGFEVLDAHGTVVSRATHSQVLTRQRIRFSIGGIEAMRLELTHTRRHQADPTTITVGGVGLGAVVQLGRRVAGTPEGGWLRLDRAPGLGEPQRSLVAAAPLVVLTYVA